MGPSQPGFAFLLTRPLKRLGNGWLLLCADVFAIDKSKGQQDREVGGLE